MLHNLKGPGEKLFEFYMDPEIHGVEVAGPSTQEVIRMCIDRVNYLNFEMPWSGNADIQRALRVAIAGFEARALIRKTEKGSLAIDWLPLGEDGHIKLC
jgi:hypothetical protein